MSIRGPNLDNEELAVAEGMVRGQTLRSIERHIGMAYRIVQEIATRPQVVKYVRHEVKRARGEARRTLTGLLPGAAAALARNMRSKDENGRPIPPAVQVQAAKIVFDLCFEKHRVERERAEEEEATTPEPEAPMEPTAQVLAGVTDAVLEALEKRLLGMRQESQGAQ